MQDIELADGRRYWEHVAERVLTWSRELGVEEDTGLVMAAAHKDYVGGTDKIITHHLTVGRSIVGDRMFFLMPGVGAQKGFVEQTVQSAFTGPGSIGVNSSSGISDAVSPSGEAENLRDKMRAAGGNC